jgi:hypothetical protein
MNDLPQTEQFVITKSEPREKSVLTFEVRYY